MSRRRRRLTRRQTWVRLLFILALLAAIGLSSLVSNITGRFEAAVFFWTLIISFIVLIIAFIILSLPSVKGRIGESKVNNVLESLTNKYGGYFIHDVIVKGDDGKTSQIDHIYICTRGVFVIETKNYAGRIYGSDNQKEWTQVLAYGNSKNKLYNPVMQNQTHIRRLDEALPKHLNMISVVVFVQGNIKYIESEHVYTLDGLKEAVEAHNANYPDSKVEAIAHIIQSYKDNPVSTDKEHVARIKETQRDIEKGICPRCGGELVLRISKKDGKKFYGCSNYPNCKFTKPVK